MKQRLIAGAGAVAIIVAAFVGRGLLFDDDGGGLSVSVDNRLLCPRDLSSICERLGEAEISLESAGTTADRLIEALDADALNGQGWIVPKVWADMVMATRAFNGEPALFEISAPLASTGVVLTIWDNVADALTCPDNVWLCLADEESQTIPGTSNRVQVGMPKIDTASGLPSAAAQAVEVIGAPDFDPDALRGAESLGNGQEDDPLATMRTRGPGMISATTLLEADAQTLNSTFGTIVIPDSGTAEVRVDVVVLTAEGSSISDDLQADITTAFTSAGWSPPGAGADGMPDGDLLAAIRGEWSK